MKIYISHSKKFDYKNELYKPLRESKLNQNHEIILPHEIYDNAKDFISKDIIKTCDLLIAEVSDKATWLWIELGWADAFWIPIICVYKKDTKIAWSLYVICNNFVEYSNKVNMIEKITKFSQSY